MSSLYDRKKIVPRFRAVAYFMLLLGICVVAKATYTATVEHDYWMKVADRLKRDSVEVKPNRGNILSDKGQLIAGTLPEYRIFMDFKAGSKDKDSIWEAKLDSICMGLHDIFPSRSAEEFKQNLEEGRAKESRHWAIWPRRISYDKFQEVKKLPVFEWSANRGGFHFESNTARQRPFGPLALRTVGDMFGAKDSARFGLEQSFDSVLRGKPGYVQRKKVMNRYLNITEQEATDGADIMTTIDVSIQDLAERALTDELKLINGNQGVAIVMEVKTGDIKAMVNLAKCEDGEYRERANYAVSDLLEPGSVFKTASILVALDDQVVDTFYKVNTFGGVYEMHGASMRDHNWRRGGYGTISLPRTLEVSSNIGVSRIIDEHYSKNPEVFVDGLERVGITADLKLPLMGYAPPRIRRPKYNEKGKIVNNWYKTTLPWMSIGYETQVPPISTLTFYNAIANDGKMMRPRFVKAIMRDNQVIKEFPPEVIKEQICKHPESIKTIQTILHHVVSQGLGKKAGSKSFPVAGKTGTAQISKGASGYKSGTTNYLLSFCGYFPANNPRYSCIVTIKKSGLPASGGGMSGVVFHNIAEGVMSHDVKHDAKQARDSLSIMLPDVKPGNLIATDYVLRHLGVKTNDSLDFSNPTKNPIWGKGTLKDNVVELSQTDTSKKEYVPDVHGMGARDAVFLLESRGLKVRLIGRGKVASQSLGEGHKIRQGDICELKLK